MAPPFLVRIDGATGELVKWLKLMINTSGATCYDDRRQCLLVADRVNTKSQWCPLQEYIWTITPVILLLAFPVFVVKFVDGVSGLDVYVLIEPYRGIARVDLA